VTMPRHDPIAEPRPVRPVVGHVVPLAEGEHVDYRLLDRPTVVRRSEPTTPDEFAELRQVCIGYYTRRIAEVEALIEMDPRPYYTERLGRLRRMLEVAGRIGL
jgi:hypothetical protein